MIGLQKRYINNQGSWLWFLISIIALLFINPFEQAIWGDRAYLIYISQTVFRELGVYESTPYGYTPLANLLSGGVMLLINWVNGSVDTIIVSRVLGIFLYAGIVTSLFKLAVQAFESKRSANLVCIAFMSFYFYMQMAAINFEPKYLALLFEIWAVQSFIKSKTFRSGLFFSLAAMCWQPMVLNCLALVPLILMIHGINKKSLLALTHFSLGVLLGTTPCLLYLYFTNDWIDFWNQAVLRKVALEGEVLFESPFDWLRKVFMTNLKPDALILAIGFSGLLLVLVNKKFRIPILNFTSKKPLTWNVLLIISFAWVIFNSLEFQAPLDFLPMLPFIILFMVSLFHQWIQGLSFPKYVLVLLCFVGYGFYDFLVPNPRITYSEQKALISDIKGRYEDPFVINFEEYYVLEEKPLPTNYIRYAVFEDYLINKNEINGCAAILDKVASQKPRAIISKTTRDSKMSIIGDCGQKIIDAFSSGKVSSFKISMGKGNLFAHKEKILSYDVYETIFNGK
ncbi:MAG: hypothetical protein Roseis2KO_56740 [Roseivirga sp.]